MKGTDYEIFDSNQASVHVRRACLISDEQRLNRVLSADSTEYAQAIAAADSDRVRYCAG